MNLFLQREDPIIGVLADQLIKFMTKLHGKFVSITTIKEAGNDMKLVAYSTRENQINGE